MSELNEPLWAVISERGCEASGMSYAVALELMRRLSGEKVHGLSVVTATAARRFIDKTPADYSSSSDTARRNA